MSRIISAEAAKRRASLLGALRRGLEARGFLEVTTPVLLKVGARGPLPTHPFTMLGETYDLRSSIELSLRSALCASPKVYDIGPAIRFEDANKGARSAVEFTLLELFAAGTNFEGLTKLAEELLAECSCTLPVRYVSVVQWFETDLGVHFDSASPAALASDMARLAGGSEGEPLWALIDRLISRYLEPTLKGLVFLVDFPIETICLAQRKAARPFVAERFEIYLQGLEIGHGFVDCHDADDVAARMAANGQQFVDHDFLDLLRAGTLPQSAGLGVGIERLLVATSPDGADVRDYLHSFQHDPVR